MTDALTFGNPLDRQGRRSYARFPEHGRNEALNLDCAAPTLGWGVELTASKGSVQFASDHLVAIGVDGK